MIINIKKRMVKINKDILSEWCVRYTLRQVDTFCDLHRLVKGMVRESIKNRTTAGPLGLALEMIKSAGEAEGDMVKDLVEKRSLLQLFWQNDSFL